MYRTRALNVSRFGMKSGWSPTSEVRILGRKCHHYALDLQFKECLSASFYLGELAWGFSRVFIFHCVFAFLLSDAGSEKQLVSSGCRQQFGDASTGNPILERILQIVLLSRSTC